MKSIHASYYFDLLGPFLKVERAPKIRHREYYDGEWEATLFAIVFTQFIARCLARVSIWVRIALSASLLHYSLWWGVGNFLVHEKWMQLKDFMTKGILGGSAHNQSYQEREPYLGTQNSKFNLLGVVSLVM